MMDAVFSLLCWFCVALGLFGLATMSIGILVQVLYFNATSLVESNILATPAFLIFVGAVIFIVAFLGCVGASKKNFCLLMIFGTLMLLLFVGGFAAGIACYLNHNEVQGVVSKNLNQTMNEYPHDKAIRKYWDLTQIELQCCGIEGPKDWLNIGNHSIPTSCCKEIPLGSKQCEDSAIYKDGCLKLVIDKFESQATVLGIVAASIAFVLIIVVIFTCYLAGSIRREYETV